MRYGELDVDSAAFPRFADPARAVERLTNAGRAGQLGLPRVADALYESARRLRVFTEGRASARLDGLMGLVVLPAEEVRQRLDAKAPLLH